MSTRHVDLTPAADMDEVAGIAFGVAEKIREHDPRRLYDELVALCGQHPAKAAQLIMTYAAWFDPDVSTQTLWRRVDAIVKPRMRATA